MIKNKISNDLTQKYKNDLTKYILKISDAESYKYKIDFLSKISFESVYTFLKTFKKDYYDNNKEQSSLLKEFSLSITIPSENKELSIKDFFVIQNIDPLEYQSSSTENILYENYVLLKNNKTDYVLSNRNADIHYLNWLSINEFIKFKENNSDNIMKNKYKQQHSYSLIKKENSIYSLKENKYMITNLDDLMNRSLNKIVEIIMTAIDDAKKMTNVDIITELLPLENVDSDYNQDVITYSNRNWLLNYNIFDDFFFSVYLVNHINNYTPIQIEKILYLMDKIIDLDSSFIIYKIKFVTHHLYHYHFKIDNTFIQKDIDAIQSLDEEQKLKCYDMFKSMIMPISHLITKNTYSINDFNSIYDFLKLI